MPAPPARVSPGEDVALCRPRGSRRSSNGTSGPGLRQTQRSGRGVSCCSASSQLALQLVSLKETRSARSVDSLAELIPRAGCSRARLTSPVGGDLGLNSVLHSAMSRYTRQGIVSRSLGKVKLGLV